MVTILRLMYMGISGDRFAFRRVDVVFTPRTRAT